jgi:hypothetical protein
MTGLELKDYLMSIPNNFFRYEPTYMVEIVDGETYNHVPTHYKAWIVGRLDIKIIIYKWGVGDRVVEFTYGDVNLFASHKLKDLDFTTLYTELNKILGYDPTFIEWSKTEIRNYKIDSLYEV